SSATTSLNRSATNCASIRSITSSSPDRVAGPCSHAPSPPPRAETAIQKQKGHRTFVRWPFYPQGVVYLFYEPPSLGRPPDTHDGLILAVFTVASIATTPTWVVATNASPPRTRACTSHRVRCPVNVQCCRCITWNTLYLLVSPI